MDSQTAIAGLNLVTQEAARHGLTGTLAYQWKEIDHKGAKAFELSFDVVRLNDDVRVEVGEFLRGERRGAKAITTKTYYGRNPKDEGKGFSTVIILEGDFIPGTLEDVVEKERARVEKAAVEAEARQKLDNPDPATALEVVEEKHLPLLNGLELNNCFPAGVTSGKWRLEELPDKGGTIAVMSMNIPRDGRGATAKLLAGRLNTAGESKMIDPGSGDVVQRDHGAARFFAHTKGTGTMKLAVYAINEGEFVRLRDRIKQAAQAHSGEILKLISQVGQMTDEEPPAPGDKPKGFLTDLLRPDRKGPQADGGKEDEGGRR